MYKRQELIILASLIRIRQYGIGLLSLLKLLLTLFITRMNVRMIFLYYMSVIFLFLRLNYGVFVTAKILANVEPIFNFSRRGVWGT